METANAYAKTAQALSNYMVAKHVAFETPEAEIAVARRAFQEQFSPERLRTLSDAELLDTIFLSVNSGNQSLCYHLEFNPTYKRNFGSISGGSSYKFGLFQRQEDRNWVTGSPQNPTILSVSEALNLGKQIRDCLVNGYEIIAGSTLETVDDYNALNECLNSELGKYASYSWFQKYFFMLFPEKLVGLYSPDLIKHYLYGLGLSPENNYYSLNGQLSITRRYTNLSSSQFYELCYSLFGDKRRFLRLGSSDGTTNYANEWRSRGIVAIGWNELSDLTAYLTNRELDRADLVAKMQTLFYQDDERTASRKAGEVKTFFETTSNDVFIVSNGERLISLVDDLTPYYFDSNEPMSHCKKGTWHMVFDEIDRLPVSEGLQTTCYEIKKPENLIYLYAKYYRLLDRFAPEITPENTDNAEDTPLTTRRVFPKRLPRASTRFPLNTILYGAPGTGKTYTTTEYAMAILNDMQIRHAATADERKALVSAYKENVSAGRIVFTTFHQSYGYEDFIQGLRPALNSDVMRFSSVDGVFKRMADTAMSDHESNYVIIIDEINRGNISKVFGELITLIEEDKRWGEANEMSVTLPSGEPFAIPNNLYIVGTMNSADKSISLIDTALRRRFDFIEIAPNAELVEDAVLRQVLKKLNAELLSELDSTDLLVGHAYFIGKTEADLIRIMNRNIIPLLYEYFFDNGRKVKAVINKAIENLPYSVEDETVGRIRISKRD